MKTLILAFALAVSSVALADVSAPPEKIDAKTYPQWLRSIKAPVSPFTTFMFSWLDEQRTRPMPSQVNADPEKLFVTIDRVLREGIRVESAGEAEEGTTYGLETFAVVDAPIATVMETILFRWGKPVGKDAGVTHPNDTVYGFREEKLSPEWGAGSFRTFTTKRNGGIAGDQNDSFALLARGNATDGYEMIGSFIAPTGDTISTSFITIITLKPMANGKTEYRVAGLLNAQNYSFFGLDRGRLNFGFNVTRIREGQKDFLSQVKALKETGKIPERQ